MKNDEWRMQSTLIWRCGRLARERWRERPWFPGRTGWEPHEGRRRGLATPAYSHSWIMERAISLLLASLPFYHHGDNSDSTQ